MTKPAKEGQEGFDPKTLVHDAEAENAEVADEKDEKDEHASDDDLSIEELDAQLRKGLEEALEDDDDEEAEPEAEVAEGDVTARLKAAEDKLAALTKEQKKKEVLRQREAAGREIIAVVKEFKLTKPELNMVVTFYQKNPELEGVVPFRQAAIRVLGLGDRASSSDSGARNGESRRSDGAQVVTRGGAGPALKREPFKTSPERGNYSNVTAAILASGAARKLIATD